MLGGLTGFIHKHRRKLVVATGIAAGGYFLVDYVKTKFFELQDRIATERAAKENLKRRFEQNQQDATYTIMALLPTLTSQVVEKYQVEQITAELQAKRGDKAVDVASSVSSLANSTTTTNNEDSTVNIADAPSVASLAGEEISKPVKSKTQLWRELKIESLTRAITLIYTSALLVFFTRLQLNILGRKNYVLSVLHLAEKQHGNSGVSLENREGGIGAVAGDTVEKLAEEEEELRISRTYLTFSWWLLNKGWVSLSERIEDAVRKHFDSVNPRTDLTLAEFSELLGHVQFEIDDPENEHSNFLHNVLPPAELESYVLAQAPSTTDSAADAPLISSALRRLLDETADFIESPNASDVITKLVHHGLSVFVGKIGVLYPAIDASTAGNADAVTAASTARAKLASILANVTKQAHGMTSGSPFDPNEYINAMINVPELDGFSALVYSNFDWSNLGLE